MSFDMKNFEEAFKLLASGSPDTSRTFNIMTGSGGMKMFNDAMEVEAAMMFLKSLYKRKLVTLQEYTSLKKMIKSPDKENLTVANSIMNIKSLPDEQR